MQLQAVYYKQNPLAALTSRIQLSQYRLLPHVYTYKPIHYIVTNTTASTHLLRVAPKKQQQLINAIHVQIPVKNQPLNEGCTAEYSTCTCTHTLYFRAESTNLEYQPSILYRSMSLKIICMHIHVHVQCVNVHGIFKQVPSRNCSMLSCG